jgi:tRNA-splicing ligase RtcB
MQVTKEGRVPLKNWAADIEDGAAEQALHLTQLPFAFHHVALMPDCHTGYGMPIGGVLATQGVVIPNAVGVDIGCGMRAFPLDCTVDEFMPKRDAIMHEIQRAIPTGFNHHHDEQEEWAGLELLNAGRLPILEREYPKSLYQLGTLGGGNHFIEAQADEDGGVWFMLHSGSRNVGLQVAKHYNDLAIELNERWHTAVPKSWELAFLPLESDEGQAYLREMNACLAFAKENRARMWLAIGEALEEQGIELDGGFDVHHNYAAMENHFGKNVMVHRKGAVRARDGELVIIPGSMGTASYIARGLDNPDSFMSCSHGAGRTMGRKAATRDPAVQKSLADMTTMLYSDSSALDEAPLAYKNIDAVMDAQADLVTPVTVLRPLAVIKA